MLQAPIRGAAPGSARSCAGARFRGHVASTNGPGSVRAWTASPTARHWWGGHWARRLAAAAGSRDLRYMNFVVLVPAQASAGRSFRKDLCNCTGIRNSMCVSLTRPRTSRGGRLPSEQPAPLHACAGQLCCGLAGLIGHSSKCSRCPGPGPAFEAATSVSEWRALRETGAPASVGVDVVEGSALCLRSEGRLAFDMRRRTMPPMVDDVSLGVPGLGGSAFSSSAMT